jgi:hypothetical protein
MDYFIYYNYYGTIVLASGVLSGYEYMVLSLLYGELQNMGLSISLIYQNHPMRERGVIECVLCF